MMKTNWILTLITGALLLARCTESLVVPYTDKPVVESYLYVGKPIQVKVMRLASFEADVALSEDDIDNLAVTISNGAASYTATPEGDGLYSAPDNLPVLEGVDYTLNFTFNNKAVSATTQALSKPKDFAQSDSSISISSFNGSFTGGAPQIPDPVKLTWSNPENDYYLVVVENIETDPIAINSSPNNAPRRVFRNEPTQTTETEIRPQSFQYFGMHRLILFHVNADYASLYKDSGTTSQNITTPPTNVTNGLGIFTAINSDTLMLEVVKK